MFQLTSSLFSISKVWRNDDSPPFPYADSQQGLVHPRDHIAHPNVGVVCAVPLVAVVKRSI